MEKFKNLENLWKSHWFTKDIEVRTADIDGAIVTDVLGLRGFLIPGDIYFLWHLGLNLPHGGKFLEIGSWLGLSSCMVAFGLLSNSNFSGKVYCIDPWEVMPEQDSFSEELKGKDLLSIFKENTKKLKVDKFIIPVKGKSPEISEEFIETDFDTIFIDGEHTFESCYQDIVTWSKRLKAGGQIFGHDAIPEGGVRKALERFKEETGKKYTILEMPYSHYIWQLHL